MQFAYNDVANSEKLMTIEIGECIVIFSIISSYYSLDLRDENKNSSNFMKIIQVNFLLISKHTKVK